MLARSTILGLALVGALVATQLHGCRETPEKQPGVDGGTAALMMMSTYETRPVITGRAAFVYDLKTEPTEIEVKLLVRATDTKPPASTGTSLQSIRFYGAPGRKGADELGTPANLLVQLDGPMKPKRDWEIRPEQLPRDKLTFKLADLAEPKRIEDYTVLMRLAYKTGSGTEDIDRIGMFSSWALPAHALKLDPFASQPGDTITGLSGKGAFFGADGIAMYDFKVDFNGTATKIEAWAAKVGAYNFPLDHHRIYSKTFASPISATHSAKDVIGRYNGVSDEYWILVEVTTDPPTPAPHEKQGTFIDILEHQGVLMSMTE